MRGKSTEKFQHQAGSGFRRVWLALRRKRVLIAFVAVGLIVVTAASVGITKMLEAAVNDSALDGAETTARVFTEVVLDTSTLDDEGRIPQQALRDLRRAVDNSDRIENVRLWDSEGRVRYQSRSLSSEEPEASDGVHAALAGELTSHVEEEEGGEEGHQSGTAETSETLLEVYVPASTAGGEGTYVLELYMSYEQVAETIAAGNRNIRLVVAGAGLAYFLLLLPQLIRISRRMERIPGRDPAFERKVTDALVAGQIVPHYQPVIDVESGEVAGVEALARWYHPDRGLLAPGTFLPEIASGPVMDRLTSVMLDLTLAQTREWDRAGRPLRVSVNVPPRLIFSSRFPEHIKDHLDRAGVPGRRLILEVTEDLISEDSEPAQQRVADLAAMGVEVSIDDFGSRHASLTRLARLGAGELKVDRSYVTGISDSPADLVVTRMVCELGDSLGMRVVAEGVEHSDDLRQIAQLRCGLVQGFLFARPMDSEQLSIWLADWGEQGRARFLETVQAAREGSGSAA
jgi:EAL domain-containing protein (putative c-di-GMP-specific phosphodiesterase class I)